MNPCAGLVLPKKGRRMPAVLTTEEARRVLAASQNHPNVRTAFRNRAIMSSSIVATVCAADTS
jgi:site-specific recombinase XerC